MINLSNTPARAHRVTFTPMPDGGAMDVTGFATDLLTDVIALLAENPGLMDDLDRAITATPPDPFHPERNLPTEQLVADLLGALPDSATSIRLHTPAVEKLAASLATVSGGQATRPKAVAA